VIANALVNEGYDTSIVSWWGGKVPFYPVDERVKCYNLFDRETINIYSSYFSSLFKYRSVIKSINPDIIIDVCVPLSLITIPVTYFPKIKRISWEHFNVKVSWNLFTAKLARWLATKFSHKIVVLTEADKNEYYNRYHAKNVIIIVNPVTIVVKELSTLKHKNILAVGRLTEQKGFDLLLRAWHHLKVGNTDNDEVKQWKLNIAGEGEDENKLKQLCTHLKLHDSVTFMGAVKNIEALYLNASIFVMSSRFEGLPLALIEAKAFGLPTISFDCETGPREVISHLKDGLLVEPENFIALSNSMQQLINSSETRRLYSVNSSEKSKNYKLEEVLKSWIGLFSILK
jgi:glycosyltransferase involved in cell wall biosynthesis